MLSFFPIENCLFPIEHFSAGDFHSACLNGQYFQHAHIIPVVGVEKRGVY